MPFRRTLKLALFPAEKPERALPGYPEHRIFHPEPISRLDRTVIRRGPYLAQGRPQC
jgi:hypothetical protein